MPDPGMKILVVDDFATMRRIIRTILKQLGYDNVEEAEDGLQAYTRLKKGGIDLVITDWNMPNMDGLEFMKRAKSEQGTKNIPFLFVTAEAEKEKVVAAVQAGVNNYIVKPFTADVLKEKIDKIFPVPGK